jgi:predicted MFS family arabinose efflux permease
MLVLRVFVPFALGYFLSYLYRVVNAVIAPDLIRDAGLDASSLGLLTSAYFLTFAAFQLPLGVLLDRIGPRRTEAALLVFAALGAIVFGLAETTGGLILGRALIGFGVSACLMAAFKAFVIWFPRERLPFVNGCQMAAGGLGAIAGTTPIEAVLGIVDWRGVFFTLGALTLVVALIIVTVVPEPNSGHGRESFRAQLQGISKVFTSSLFWRAAPLTVTAQAAFLAIQSLWAGPWLRDVAGLNRAEVADHLLLIAAAMVAGFLSIGWAAQRFSRLGLPPLVFAVCSIAVFIAVQLALVMQAPKSGSVTALWMAFGFFGTSGIVPYAALSQQFPPYLAGRVNSGINVLVFTTAFAAQWGIGAVIGLWPNSGTEGYAPAGYRAAFVVMLALQLLALLWFVSFRRGGVPEDRTPP